MGVAVEPYEVARPCDFEERDVASQQLYRPSLAENRVAYFEPEGGASSALAVDSAVPPIPHRVVERHARGILRSERLDYRPRLRLGRRVQVLCRRIESAVDYRHRPLVGSGRSGSGNGRRSLRRGDRPACGRVYRHDRRVGRRPFQSASRKDERPPKSDGNLAFHVRGLSLLGLLGLLAFLVYDYLARESPAATGRAHGRRPRFLRPDHPFRRGRHFLLGRLPLYLRLLRSSRHRQRRLRTRLNVRRRWKSHRLDHDFELALLSALGRRHRRRSGRDAPRLSASVHFRNRRVGGLPLLLAAHSLGFQFRGSAHRKRHRLRSFRVRRRRDRERQRRRNQELPRRVSHVFPFPSFPLVAKTGVPLRAELPSHVSPCSRRRKNCVFSSTHAWVSNVRKSTGIERFCSFASVPFLSFLVAFVSNSIWNARRFVFRSASCGKESGKGATS